MARKKIITGERVVEIEIDISKLYASAEEFDILSRSPLKGKGEVVMTETGESIMAGIATTSATAVVLKGDNPYVGVIQNESSRGLFAKGSTLLHRRLEAFVPGSLVNVTMEFRKGSGSDITRISQHKAQPPGITDVVRTVTEPTPTEIAEAIDIARSMASILGKEVHEVLEAADLRELLVHLKGEDLTVTEQVTEPPLLLEGFYISDETRLIFNTAFHMSNAAPQRAIKVMMVGPSGCGKTTLPRIFAQIVGKNFLRMNCASIRDPEEWFGYREAVEGSTVFVRSQLMKLLEEGNCVVVLDEFNRLEPWLHNTLYPMLDDDGATVIHDEHFSIGEGVVVVGTINTGYKYTGIFELDEALLNRFDLVLPVDNLPHAEEVRVLTAQTTIDKKDAALIAKVATKLRQLEVACSLRTTLRIAAMVTSGMTIREAFETSVVHRIPAEASGNTLRKTVLDAINTEVGVYRPRTSFENDIFKGVKERIRSHQVELALTNKDANKIAVISILRSLQLRNDNDEPYEMTYGQAQNLFDGLVKGQQVTLNLYKRPEYLDNLIEKMRTVGLTGQFLYR